MGVSGCWQDAASDQVQLWVLAKWLWWSTHVWMCSGATAGSCRSDSQWGDGILELSGALQLVRVQVFRPWCIVFRVCSSGCLWPKLPTVRSPIAPRACPLASTSNRTCLPPDANLTPHHTSNRAPAQIQPQCSTSVTRSRRVTRSLCAFSTTSATAHPSGTCSRSHP
jgi:hypothetical protein